LQFLSQLPETAILFFDPIPARTIFNSMEFDYQTEMGAYSPSERALINEALQHALPASEILFYDYINLALFNSRYERASDIISALQEAELQAIADLERAETEWNQPLEVV